VDEAGVEERESDEDDLEEAGVEVDVEDVVAEPVVIALSTLVVTIAGCPCELKDAAVIKGGVVLGADDVTEELITEDRRAEKGEVAAACGVDDVVAFAAIFSALVVTTAGVRKLDELALDAVVMNCDIAEVTKEEVVTEEIRINEEIEEDAAVEEVGKDAACGDEDGMLEDAGVEETAREEGDEIMEED
jgi:hypothetical protein